MTKKIDGHRLLKDIPPSLIDAFKNPQFSDIDRSRELMLLKDQCNIPSEDLFRAILFLIKMVSSKRISNFNNNTELARISEPYIENAVAEESRAKNKSSVSRLSTLFLRLCFSIEYVYGPTTLEFLGPDEVIHLWGHIINPAGKLYPGINRFNTAFNILSNISAKYNGRNRSDYSERLEEVKLGLIVKAARSNSLLKDMPTQLIGALTTLELSDIDRARELSFIKHQCNVASDDLFRAVLFLTSRVSSSRVISFINSTELADISEPYIENAVAEESRAKNMNFISRQATMFLKLCFSIDYVYGPTSLESLGPDEVMDLWGHIIAPTERSYPDLKRFNMAFNILSNISAKHNGNSRNDYADRLSGVRFGSFVNSVGSHYEVNYFSHKISNKFPRWMKLWHEWFETLILKNVKGHESAIDHFIAHLIKNNHTDDPGKYLLKRQKPSFWDDLKQTKIKRKQAIFTPVYSFTSWVVDEGMFGQGEYIVTQTVLNELKHYTNHQLRSSESNKEVLPTLWVNKCHQILTEDDFKWPKSIKSHYFNWLNPESDKIEKVWCPSVTYSFLLMLELPVRKIQVQQLDSGEGDDERYNPQTKKWELNSGPHAKYWEKIKTRRNARGAIAKIFNEGKAMAGLYINTNKTQDIATGHDESSGYTIPWENEVIIKIIDNMRHWQEKYNPLSSPTEYRDLPQSTFSGRPSSLALDQIPPRFYLFRNPCGTKNDAPTSDALLFKFWHMLMAELERRLNEEGEDVTVVLGHDQNGTPCKSLFTPHGLRVSGLTSLAEQGVPIEVLSKIIAGHANILMTLHYIKYSPGYITEVLNEARHKADMEAQDRFIKQINNATFDEAKYFAVANSEDAISVIASQSGQGIKNTYSGSTIGLCPYNGTACSTGGPLIRKNGKNPGDYGAVEGGEGNCSRCRHLVTGTPWLINLWLEGNKKLADAQKLSKHLDSLRAEKNELDNTRYQLIKANKKSDISRDLVKKISQLDAFLEKKSHELDGLLMTAHALHNLIEKVKAASEMSGKAEDKASQSVIIATDLNAPIHYQGTTRLEAIDTVIQGSRLWRHVEDIDLERERDSFIDKVLFNSGITPVAFTPLSDDEKRMASDAASSFLLANLSAVEINQLDAGLLTLQQLGLSHDIKSVIKKLEPMNVLPSKHAQENTILGIKDESCIDE
jgi:hypothetical protein